MGVFVRGGFQMEMILMLKHSMPKWESHKLSSSKKSNKFLYFNF